MKNTTDYSQLIMDYLDQKKFPFEDVVAGGYPYINVEEEIQLKFDRLVDRVTDLNYVILDYDIINLYVDNYLNGYIIIIDAISNLEYLERKSNA